MPFFMDNNLVQQVKDAISRSNSIGVVVGQNPTLDDMAATLSLYLLLNQIGKKVVVASPTTPLVEVSSLVGINKVQTNLGGEAGDLVVSFPYAEGEIDKVSYTLENNQLNIIVKSGEKGLSFDERDVRYTRGSGRVDLLFVVGTARLSDLGELAAGDKLSGAKIINIDNKGVNQKFGDIVLVYPQATSVTEVVGDLILSLGLNIDQDAAQNMLSGLTSATNNFQDPRTSALAFEVASFAVKSGAKRDGAARAQATTFMTTQQVQQMQQPPQQQQFSNNQQMERQKFEDLTPERPSTFQEVARPQPQTETQRVQRIQEDLQQEHAASQTKEAPIDWLSPKVYKGSTNV